MGSLEHCNNELLGVDDQLVADPYAGYDTPHVRHAAGAPLNVGDDHFHFSYPAARVSQCDEALSEPDHQRPGREELTKLVMESTATGILLAATGGRGNLSAAVKAFLAVLGKSASVGKVAKNDLRFLVSELPKLKGPAFASRLHTINGVAANEVKASDPDLFRAFSNLRNEALKNK